MLIVDQKNIVSTMKFEILFGILLISTYSAAEFCYNDIEGACGSTPMIDGGVLANCDARYGEIDGLLTDLQAYANAQIETSFEYLIMSTHFGNYEAHRPGFKALYRKLSDTAWNNAIDIIKFITKRGGKMNFNQPPRFKRNTRNHHLELSEVHSLAKALDTEKKLAEEALRIHNHAQTHSKHDGSVAHYIEEKFLEPQADSIRELAGYTTELKSLLMNRNPAISVFLFDEELQKMF